MTTQEIREQQKEDMGLRPAPRPTGLSCMDNIPVVGFTYDQLKEAFELVLAPFPQHWKGRINAWITSDKVPAAMLAIEFFTGSKPLITQSRWDDATGDWLVHVRAAGYHAAVDGMVGT